MNHNPHSNGYESAVRVVVVVAAAAAAVCSIEFVQLKLLQLCRCDGGCGMNLESPLVVQSIKSVIFVQCCGTRVFISFSLTMQPWWWL